MTGSFNSCPTSRPVPYLPSIPLLALSSWRDFSKSQSPRLVGQTRWTPDSFYVPFHRKRNSCPCLNLEVCDESAELPDANPLPSARFDSFAKLCQLSAPLGLFPVVREDPQPALRSSSLPRDRWCISRFISHILSLWRVHPCKSSNADTRNCSAAVPTNVSIRSRASLKFCQEQKAKSVDRWLPPQALKPRPLALDRLVVDFADPGAKQAEAATR